MSTQLMNAEACSFTPSTLLSLFTLDGTNIGMQQVFNFYDGVANNYKPIVFDGTTYTAFPIKMEDMSIDGRGQLVRPKVTVGNLQGFVSALLLNNDSLIGAKLSRTRVFARFIDAVNFPRNKNPFGIPDSNAAYPPDVFYVNRKTVENQQVVQWELSSLLEIDGVRLPNRRMLANVCSFRYRDGSCHYDGPPIADQNNKLFVGGAGTYGFASLTNKGQYSASTTYNAGDYVYLYSTLDAISDVPAFYVCINNGIVGINNSPLYNTVDWAPDACSYSIFGCKIRYPSPTPLPFGGFPGTTTAPFLVTR